MIDAGEVRVNGTPASKPATNITRDTPVVVAAVAPDWASRGAHKLLGALGEFGPRGVTVTGKRCLDAGASTGGFTDVLLAEGAREVVAADVGYGQLIWRLQNDPRVIVHDRTNVRTLTADAIGGPAELTVSDLSFISLRLVLRALASCTVVGGDLLPMVKPQFEVGKDRVGAGGVVRDPQLRIAAVRDVIADGQRLGLTPRGVVASPLPGPSGNVEYFVWFRKDRDVPGVDDPAAAVVETAAVETADHGAQPPGAQLSAAVEEMIGTAVEEGPQ